MNASSSPSTPASPQPWWRYGHVWLVLAGPALVVLASLYTMYLAVSTPDPVLTAEAMRQDQSQLQEQTSETSGALTPALQARNHAQTGLPRPIATQPGAARP